MFRKSIYIFISIIIAMLLTTNVYADASSSVSYNLTQELSASQMAELENFDTLSKMMIDIFSFDRHMGDSSFNDVGTLLFELIDTSIVNFDIFTNSVMYMYIQGIALLFVMINFMIKRYEDNQFNVEGETINKEVIQNSIYFLFAILAIVMLKYYVQFLLSFFRFIVDEMVFLRSSNDLGTPEVLTNTINPRTVAYYILADSKLVGSGSLIQEVIIRSKEASLRSMYMFPWIITWISKVGELVIILLNSTLFVIYGTFYSLSLSNILDGLKNSNFLEYSKNMTAIAVEEIVILGTIYISEIMLNPFINRILNNIAQGSSDLSFVSMAVIVTAVCFTKFILLILTFSLSRKLLGAV